VSNSQITIFYSWQSDLSGSETRNIIQDAIKDAVKLLRDTVDIEADRDTKGEYGSPDIAQTIFSKIDDCDIFIADVSAVCQYETTDKDGNKKVKYMPNPNVMLELGYATHVVGWENVICVLNADYGAPEDMPFDIASRRLTPFSTKDGKSKGEIKRYIKGVIQDTVENLLENGKRVKTGFSDLRMGCYVDGTISKFLYPIEISKSAAFVKHREQIIEECLQLIEQIKSIKITEPSELLSEAEGKNTNVEKDVEETSIIRKDGSVLTPIKNSLTLNLFKLQKVTIKDDDKKSIITLCKDYLGIDISDEIEFFNIGNLERKNDLLLSYTYEGTEEEELKYDKIMEFEYKLHRIQMMDWYVTTFDGMLFIPLAIENASTVYDEDIDIHIIIQENDAEIIYPSKKLINPDMQGSEGVIFEEGILKELLLMVETSDISYDGDISYSIADSLVGNQKSIGAYFDTGGINGNPRYDEEDYEREISKYIAMPNSDSKSEFEFTISSLRPKEKKWLGPALLIKPLKDSFDIKYSIKSKHSDGNLSGIVEFNQ
jgi:hypothetical protein